MLPYYLLIAVPFLASGLLSKIKELSQKRTKIFMFIFFAIFLALVACRDLSIGVDNLNYKYYFEKFASVGWAQCFTSDIEPGYALLCKVVSLFTDNYQVFVAVVAIISIIPVARFYAKETEMPLLTMAFFLGVFPFSMYFSGLRQVVAMAFVFPALKYVENKKLFKFILTVLLATLFHQSSFLILALYPVYHFKITPKKLMVIVPMLAILLALNKQIFNIGLSILGGKYLDKYGAEQSTGAYTMIILFAIMLIYSFVMVNENDLTDREKSLRNILFLIFAIQCFAPLNTVVMRLNYYFLVLAPVIMSKLAKKSTLKWGDVSRIVSFTICAFFIAYFILKMHTGEDILKIYPYKAFWQ